MKRQPVVVVAASGPKDVLRVVEVGEKCCVMSTGEILIVRYETFRKLLEQLAQERAEVWIRTWTASDGEELIDCYRVGEMGMNAPTDHSEASEDVF